jgi:phosphoglycerol transferase MdoB-like AlkP superfamily enzyme
MLGALKWFRNRTTLPALIRAIFSLAKQRMQWQYLFRQLLSRVLRSNCCSELVLLLFLNIYHSLIKNKLKDDKYLDAYASDLLQQAAIMFMPWCGSETLYVASLGFS